eukprot:tig00020904_g15185.t1
MAAPPEEVVEFDSNFPQPGDDDYKADDATNPNTFLDEKSPNYVGRLDADTQEIDEVAFPVHVEELEAGGEEDGVEFVSIEGAAVSEFYGA